MTRATTGNVIVIKIVKRTVNQNKKSIWENMALCEFVFDVCRSASGFIGFLAVCTAAFLAAYVAISVFFYAIWIVSVLLMRRVLSDVDVKEDDKPVPVAAPAKVAQPKKRARSRSRSKRAKQ